MIRAELGTRTDGPLFLNRRGNRVSADVWRRRTWNPTVEALGIPEATPHWLRHSLATLLAQHGMSAYDLRTHFGWETSRIADRYVKKGQGVRRIADTLEVYG
jgi:site-specific recombinase XerD